MSIKTPLTHTTIATNGIHLHVVQAGEENGKLVILLHGFPEFWYGWRNQIDFLVERGYRVWIPDQRGYNLSDKPKGVSAYSVDNLTADMLGLLDASGRDTCYLVGHDWGAVVAWATAMTAPQRIEKLAILNVPHPVVFQRLVRSHFAQLRRSWYMFAFQLPRLPEYLFPLNSYKAMTDALKGMMKQSQFSDEELEQYRQAWAQPSAVNAMLNWYRAVFRYPPSATLDPYLKMPTRIIWGKQDSALIPEGATQSMAFVANGELFFLEKAGHFVQHEDPQRVNQLLGDFLA